MVNRTATGIYNPYNPDTDGDSSTALEPAERSKTAKEIADLQDKILS